MEEGCVEVEEVAEEEEEGVEGEGGNFNALSCLEEGGGPEGVGVSVEVVEVVSPET